MNKIFSLIFIGLFYCNLSFAGCTDDIDVSWNYLPGKVQISFEFLNNKNKKIKITEVRLFTIEKEIARTLKPYKGVLIPFGKMQILFPTFDLNTNIINSAGYTCEYE